MWGDSIEHRDPRREYAGASVLCVTIGFAALFPLGVPLLGKLFFGVASLTAFGVGAWLAWAAATIKERPTPKVGINGWYDEDRRD